MTLGLRRQECLIHQTGADYDYFKFQFLKCAEKILPARGKCCHSFCLINVEIYPSSPIRQP